MLLNARQDRNQLRNLRHVICQQLHVILLLNCPDDGCEGSLGWQQPPLSDPLIDVETTPVFVQTTEDLLDRLGAFLAEFKNGGFLRGQHKAKITVARRD